MEEYDIDVEYDVLCMIEKKLRIIAFDIENSTQRMNEAIQRAQVFLSGNQFEKAKKTTIACVEKTRITQSNIKSAEEYIKKLKAAVDEYGKCLYSGE